ncbi:unnamed protein product [Effrenium voratum]|nr:unnamed protein product [Effrenium voratum]
MRAMLAAAAMLGTAQAWSSGAVSCALLQTKQARQTPAFHYEPQQMWNLDADGGPWRVAGSELLFPSHGETEVSHLSGGRLEVWRPLQRWRLDLALPATQNRSHPGKNPALLPLPERLSDAFPEGRWLAAGRAGWMRCPGMEDFAAGQAEYMMNTYCSGPLADGTFPKIAVEGDDRTEGAVMDLRLFAHSSGRILVSFQAYCQLELTHAFLAELHLDVGPRFLRAWLRSSELQRLKDCRKDTAKKNPGFLESQGRTYILDRVYPTTAGVLDEIVHHESHNLTTRNGELHVQTTCLHTEPKLVSAAAPTSPWRNCRGQQGPVRLHNGPSPVWLKDRQVFLGLGHLRRGRREAAPGYFLPHHYTHQFFLLAGTPPFGLLAVTTEFCFSSRQDEEDCESIQFASSLLLEGDSLLIGLGVQDCESFVHRFDLHYVLGRLINVSG